MRAIAHMIRLLDLESERLWTSSNVIPMSATNVPFDRSGTCSRKFKECEPDEFESYDRLHSSHFQLLAYLYQSENTAGKRDSGNVADNP